MENSFFSLKEEGRIKRKKTRKGMSFPKTNGKMWIITGGKRIKKENLKENLKEILKAEEKVKGKGFFKKR